MTTTELEPASVTRGQFQRDRRHSIALGRIARTVVELKDQMEALSARVEEIGARAPIDRDVAAVAALAAALQERGEHP